MEDEDGRMRIRSFRHENYSNRRAFLRSYPLLWDEEPELVAESEEEKKVSSKRRLTYVLHSHGKRRLLVVLRKFKSKVVLCLVSCHAFGLTTNKNKRSATDFLASY